MTAPNTESSVRDRRAVKNARSNEYRKGRKHFRWAAVSRVFAIGSTFSIELCRRFGLDPEEFVKR